MSISKIITIVGISFILIYVIIQILTFYGVGTDVYGVYITFYLFLLLSLIVLPNSYSSLKYGNE